MNPSGSSKTFITVMSALALSLVLAAIHWVVMHNVIEVCYTLDAPGGRTQVYWDTGSGFNEENTRMTVDHSGPGPAYFCFSSVWMRGVRAIRIDPIDYAGGFDISAIELAYKDVIFPFQFINSFELETSAAILEGVIRGPGGSTQFQSSGGDPTLTWAVPMKRTGGISLLLVTIGLLGVVVLAITFLSLRGIRSPGCLVSLLPLLLIYPIYLLLTVCSPKIIIY